MPKWTGPQLDALNSDKGNYLVSAGAGSGKTATLTERVHQLLLKGHSIDEFLILTFTDKAASQMKDKIREMIYADPTLINELPKLDASHIMTFDAYSMEIVKKYHYVLNLSNDIAISTNGVLEVEKYLYLESLFNEYYEKSDVRFLNLVMTHCDKNDDKIKDYVIKLENLAAKKPDELGFLDSYIETYFNEEKIDKDIELLIKTIKEDIFHLTSSFTYRISNGDLAFAVDEVINALLDVKETDAFLTALKEISFPTLQKKIYKLDNPAEKDFYKTYKEKITNIRTKYGDFASISSIKSQYLETKEFVELIVELTKKLYVHLSKFKNKHNLYSFADISHFALDLVNRKDIAKEISEDITYIMVDEYQDTNQIQEDFINAIAKNNVYVVGDVKQSIYRFRGADCEIFRNKNNSFVKDPKKGTVIELLDNFRTRPELLHDINLMFYDVMSETTGGANYHKQAFKESNPVYDSSSFADNQPLEIKMYQVPEGFTNNKLMLHEARLTAQDIKLKYENKYQVYDKKLKVMRNCEYSDFAVLVERTAYFEPLSKAFNEYGIPLKIETDIDVRESDLILTVKGLFDLLTYISSNEENEIAFKHAFASIARSYLCSYDDKKIRELLIDQSYKKDEIYLKISRIARYAIHRSIEDTFKYLINAFGIIEKLYLCNDSIFNSEKIQILIETAIEMDNIGYTVKDFDFYLNNLEKYNAQITVEPDSKPGDFVKSMTIHKSKGLEFKITYLYGGGFTYRPFTESRVFKATDDYGIILGNPLDDSTNFYSYLHKHNEDIATTSEKIRLFYVALTRAEDKMIITTPELQYEPTFGIEGCRYFYQFMENARLENRMFSILKTETIPFVDTSKSTIETKEYTVKKLNIENKVINLTRASKGLNDEDVNHDILEFGTHIHYLLELTDFHTKDTSFIKDKNDKELIDKFLKNPLFGDIKKAKVFHEYQFITDDLKGIIDLLLIYPDHATIVDFKLKHIDDEAYARQVGIYADYVSSVFKLPVKKYLISVLTGEYNEVK